MALVDRSLFVFGRIIECGDDDGFGGGVDESTKEDNMGRICKSGSIDGYIASYFGISAFEF